MCPKCGTPQRQLLARGTVLRGRYRIEAVRGCGGFGAVYRVIDLQTGQIVAVKENQRHQTFQRFEREGKLLMQLSHPNLPRVWEVFVDQTTGRAFLVMDFVDGETLEEMLQRLHRPLTWQEAEPIFAQVVVALNHLHRNKIVHRDIKPSNIIVTKRYETVYSEVDDREEIIAPPPKLTEDHIAKLTDGKRFERGMNYWRDGWRLEGLQRDGWMLTGRCWGEQRHYKVLAELTKIGIGKRSCECSDFHGRRLCKHLVALLLAWVHEPQRFKIVSEKKERRPVKRRVPRQVERQWVMLVDFGVAKVMEEVDPKRPRSSSIIAWTDGYSPPEQYASGGQIDVRADQYALAATMVFALTGKTPDDAFTRMEKFRKGEPTLPAKPDRVPESAWKAIEIAMRFEPSQRFGSVTDFWEAVKGRRKLPAELKAAELRAKIKLNLIWQAISGAIVGAILLAFLGAIGGASAGVILSAFGLPLEDTLAGVIIGANLTAFWGAIGKAKESANDSMKALVTTGTLVIIGAIGGAILGAILSAIGIKLKGAMGGAIIGAILSAILGAIGGAVEGVEKCKG